METKKLKEKYEKLALKYKLPSFKELNQTFEIDRIDRDPEEILREIRKSMMDKILGYIRFVEMLINPSQAPPSFVIFTNSITQTERAYLEKVYKKFIELELDSIKLEIDYSEKQEALIIKKIFDSWNDSKESLRKIIEFMERNWRGILPKKEKSYFG